MGKNETGNQRNIWREYPPLGAKKRIHMTDLKKEFKYL